MALLDPLGQTEMTQSHTSTTEIPTLSNTSGLKKEPLSGGSLPKVVIGSTHLPGIKLSYYACYS